MTNGEIASEREGERAKEMVRKNRDGEGGRRR